MHELAIVEGILETVIPAVKKYPDVKRIVTIKLQIGELSGVVPECIHEYFLIAAQGTIAEGAKIEIERIPVGIKCGSCGYEGPFEGKVYRCPKCGGIDYRIVSGREYYVDSVEAE